MVIASIFFDRANKFHRKFVYRVLFSRSIPLSSLSLSLETLLSCVLEKGFYDDVEFFIHFTRIFHRDIYLLFVYAFAATLPRLSCRDLATRV